MIEINQKDSGIIKFAKSMHNAFGFDVYDLDDEYTMYLRTKLKDLRLDIQQSGYVFSRHKAGSKKVILSRRLKYGIIIDPSTVKRIWVVKDKTTFWFGRELIKFVISHEEKEVFITTMI
jgi:hypothetical protein